MITQEEAHQSSDLATHRGKLNRIQSCALMQDTYNSSHCKIIILTQLGAAQRILKRTP